MKKHRLTPKQEFESEFGDQFRKHLKQIGGRLKDLRIARKLTVAQVSELVNETTSELNVVEAGDRDYKLEIFFKLCHFYKVKMEKIIPKIKT